MTMVVSVKRSIGEPERLLAFLTVSPFLRFSDAQMVSRPQVFYPVL